MATPSNRQPAADLIIGGLAMLLAGVPAMLGVGLATKGPFDDGIAPLWWALAGIVAIGGLLFALAGLHRLLAAAERHFERD